MVECRTQPPRCRPGFVRRHRRQARCRSLRSWRQDGAACPRRRAVTRHPNTSRTGWPASPTSRPPWPRRRTGPDRPPPVRASDLSMPFCSRRPAPSTGTVRRHPCPMDEDACRYRSWRPCGQSCWRAPCILVEPERRHRLFNCSLDPLEGQPLQAFLASCSGGWSTIRFALTEFPASRSFVTAAGIAHDPCRHAAETPALSAWTGSSPPRAGPAEQTVGFR